MRIVFLPEEQVLSAAYAKMTEFMKERSVRELWFVGCRPARWLAFSI